MAPYTWHLIIYFTGSNVWNYANHNSEQTQLLILLKCPHILVKFTICTTTTLFPSPSSFLLLPPPLKFLHSYILSHFHFSPKWFSLLSPSRTMRRALCCSSPPPVTSLGVWTSMAFSSLQSIKRRSPLVHFMIALGFWVISFPIYSLFLLFCRSFCLAESFLFSFVSDPSLICEYRIQCSSLPCSLLEIFFFYVVACCFLHFLI